LGGGNMNVKGTVFLTGKVAIVANFGEASWNSFNAKLAKKEKYFNNIIMSVTQIPEDKFAFFLDELIKEYFNNDINSYLMFGKVAAKFALSQGGPYYAYLLSNDLKYVVETIIPKLWTTYFDEGILTARIENNVVHIKIAGIPSKHIYFEYIFAGYVQKGIKMFGKKAVETCVRGFSKGDDDIYYTYQLKDS
jgi:hypothetical protein